MNASTAHLDQAQESAPATPARHPPVTHEPVWVKWLLVTVGLGWFAALLLLPLATVFIQALSPGLSFFWHAISEPDAQGLIIGPFDAGKAGGDAIVNADAFKARPDPCADRLGQKARHGRV